MRGGRDACDEDAVVKVSELPDEYVGGVLEGNGGGAGDDDTAWIGAVCGRVKGAGDVFRGAALEGPSNADTCADLSMKDLNSYLAG